MATTAQKILTALPAEGACIRTQALAEKTGIAASRVANLIVSLTRSGLATAPRIGCYKRTPKGDRFLAEGQAVRAGRPAGAGGAQKHPRDNTLRGRVWTALRRLRKATTAELLELAVTGKEKDAYTNVRRYLRLLEQCGVILRLATREPGTALTSNGFARWSLIRDLGPKPPVARGIGLYDANATAMIEPEPRAVTR